MGELDRHNAARELYARLSPEERRVRLSVRPAYRSARDRILDSEDRTTLPRYVLTKWLPLVGAEPFALWLVMRDMARVEAMHSDSWCWPDQNELAARIGVSKNTLRKLLGVLEQHGFIRSERRRERATGSWGRVQGTNRYEVFVDVPLVEEDAVELFMDQAAGEVSGPEFKFCTQGREPVENALSSSSALRAAELKNCTQGGEENRGVSRAEFKTCAPNVNNEVNQSNVRDKVEGGARLRDHPAVKRLGAAEKRERARLAVEIGETLQRMSGSRETGPHKSLGFHRRVAFLLGPTLTRQALRATRDAVDDRRAGRGGVRQDPAAFFGGIVKELAREHGIDLGLKARREEPGPHAPMGPREDIRRDRAKPECISPEERQRVQKMLRELVKGWESEGRPPAK